MLYHIRIIGGANFDYSTVMNVELNDVQLRALRERVHEYAAQGKPCRMYIDTERELKVRTTPEEALKEVNQLFSLIPSPVPSRERQRPTSGIH